MPDTSTLTATDEIPYAELIAQISDDAGFCTTKLTRTTVKRYVKRRSFFTTEISTTVANRDGSNVQPLHIGPFEVSGWSLCTKPFFLSDPSFGEPGALHIMHPDGTADAVDTEFYRECLSAFPLELVLPARKLHDVRRELKWILKFKP